MLLGSGRVGAEIAAAASRVFDWLQLRRTVVLVGVGHCCVARLVLHYCWVAGSAASRVNGGSLLKVVAP